MKRLLITGFAPFGGDRVNPSWQAVQALPETVGGWELYKRELPVTFRGAPGVDGRSRRQPGRGDPGTAGGQRDGGPDPG